MANRFRLHADTLFVRTEESNQQEPLRIIFLSVEGNDTESQYFTFVEKYKDRLGIKMGVHVHTLKRMKSDTNSAPEDVLELLQEYLEIRNSEELPPRIRSQIPEVYSDDFIQSYLQGDDNLDRTLKKRFDILLKQVGIDLEYGRFLRDYTGKDDIFGIIVDRDKKSHSVQQLRAIKQQCYENGFKFFITTPLIEFWLLLHLADIKKDYSDRLEEFRLNPGKSSKHTMVSYEVSQLARHTKHLSEKTFVNLYLPNIDYAIQQVSESFCTDIDLLIGTDESEDSEYGELGTNLPELFALMREI